MNYFHKTFVQQQLSMKCNLMPIYLIKCIHTRTENRGKQVYVAVSKNEIINFTVLTARHIV